MQIKVVVGWFPALLKGLSSKILPGNIELPLLPDTFADFFTQKIDDIREGLHSGDNTSIHCEEVTVQDDMEFSAFKPMTVNDVTSLICGMKNKSCSLDPMPTELVKTALKLSHLY